MNNTQSYNLTTNQMSLHYQLRFKSLETLSGRGTELGPVTFLPQNVVHNMRKVKDVRFQLYTAVLNKKFSFQEVTFTATMYEAYLKLFEASV